MDTRADSHIPADVKERANRELAAHGLSISNFIRMTLSSVADNGLPKYRGVPNTETMSSINEATDDLSKHKLEGASPCNELGRLLDE